MEHWTVPVDVFVILFLAKLPAKDFTKTLN